MNRNSQPKVIVGLSVLLAGLITIISCVGIFESDFYAKETINWQIQSNGQDIIDLVIVVPLLLVTSLLTSVNRKIATLLWAGIILYLIYTLLIYCFDIHFNKLFVVYCLALGLATYSFIYFLDRQSHERSSSEIGNSASVKVIAYYFLLLSTMFYFLWLSDIMPAVMSNTLPVSLEEAGLPTNPVHVIDLSIFLPGIFIVGILLLRKRHFGFTLTPVLLVFFVLMDITICCLNIMMMQRGQGGSNAVSLGMAFFSLLSLVLLVWYLLSLQRTERTLI